MTNYFQQERFNWIVETVQIYNYINREHVMRKFGVSEPQASSDLGAVASHFPRTFVYNKSSKRYEWVAD